MAAGFAAQRLALLGVGLLAGDTTAPRGADHLESGDLQPAVHRVSDGLGMHVVAEVEAVLQAEQAGHQAHAEARAARRAGAAAELAFKRTGDVHACHPLGRARLVGQLGRHRRCRCDRGAWQPRGQHRQWMLQVNQLIQAGAKKIGGDMRQIAQKSGD